MRPPRRKLLALQRKEAQLTQAISTSRVLGLGRTPRTVVVLHPTWREAVAFLRARDAAFFRDLPIDYDAAMTRRAVCLRALRPTTVH